MNANLSSRSGETALPILRGMSLAVMTAFLESAGHPAFRARQLFQWVHEKGARSFDEMTNLSKEMRSWLEANTRLGGLEQVEIIGVPDETQKMVLRTNDDEYIESVLMRGEEADDEEESDGGKGSTAPLDKVSLCVSSQVGCALGCLFCMTGAGGFRRNLRVDEILDQVHWARRGIQPHERLSNLVFMGMGEPMLNLEMVVPALQLLTDATAFAISTRRITVSTCGIVPGIESLGAADVGVNLAVSLNATTQEARDYLMPACRKWPLEALLDACRRFPLPRRRRITFEYVLFKGINDTVADMRRLQGLLQGIPCKINLILYNPVPGLELQPTTEERAEAIRDTLGAANFTASLRRSKGRRHNAACGQLAAHYQRKQNGNA